MQQDALWLLIHSPLVGPLSWSLVADALKSRGRRVATPTLRDADSVAEPYWRQHAAAVARELAAAPPEQPLVLAGHSGAGPLLPAIRAALPNPIAAYLFVDAGLPRDQASRIDLLAHESPAIARELGQLLAAGERFPNWSDQQLRSLLPDPELRRRLLAEVQPRALPFFSEPLPVFAGWPDAPCAYLQLSAVYQVHAQTAQRLGWPVRDLEAGHFHLLVAPEAVAQAMTELYAAASQPAA
jgi:surfactin synthase thioesterase subunit